MRLLALETSTDACSVAVGRDDAVVCRHEVVPREHTARLLPMIRDVLTESGLTTADLDGLVLGIGPGSFIGVRIAASVAQGIAFAAGKLVVPVSSMAALAADVIAADDDVSTVLVAQDARMNEVYLAAFERGCDGLPVPLGPATLHPADKPVAVPGPAGLAVAAGGGWQRYPGLVAAGQERILHRTNLVHPRAEALLRIGIAEWRAGRARSPEAIAPEYVRTKVAERSGL